MPPPSLEKKNGVPDGTDTGWVMFSGLYTQSASPFSFPQVPTDTAPTAYERVLASVGASATRDAVDLRVLNDVRRGTGAIINSETNVGGWPTLNSTAAPVDSAMSAHEAMKRVLLRESLNQPLMVIFEDLHWIDGETQGLLNLLVDSLGTARILLLVNYRPEYQHQWGSRTCYTQLRLDPLGRGNAEEMLSSLLGDQPELAPLKRLIIERTEGNPFFMEEIVQALVAGGHHEQFNRSKGRPERRKTQAGRGAGGGA